MVSTRKLMLTMGLLTLLVGLLIPLATTFVFWCINTAQVVAGTAWQMLEGTLGYWSYPGTQAMVPESPGTALPASSEEYAPPPADESRTKTPGDNTLPSPGTSLPTLPGEASAQSSKGVEPPPPPVVSEGAPPPPPAVGEGAPPP